MNYSEYLFSCLLKLYSKKFKELEYDLQYELGIKEYKDFENSKFNNINKSEYDCIIDYLKNKYYNLDANRELTIGDVNISTKLYNILKLAGIHTLGQLEETEVYELFKLRNFGRFCLTECEKLLETYNLKSLYR